MGSNKTAQDVIGYIKEQQRQAFKNFDEFPFLEVLLNDAGIRAFMQGTIDMLEKEFPPCQEEE